MRRSFAPSQKSRTLQSSSTSTASGSLSRWRGTSHILELLNSGSQECSPIDGEDSCPVKDEFAANSQCSDSNQVPNKQPIESQTDSSQETVTGTPANKRYFNVVYGKQSKKKHKTWEGDGILEVANNAVVLKDTEGKILGRASGKKFSNIEEGTQFYVGSKEVEILDEISSDSVPFSMQQPLKSKENDSKESCAPPKKKQKIEKFEKMFSCPVKSRPVVDGSNVLMMPRPDHDHQWKFNTENSERRDVFVEERLASKLRPHQKEGVTFLYRCVVGLRNSEYLGAILADEMGLGKTLQTITLVWTLMKQGPYGVALLKRVLIVTPSSLLGNWNQEFRRWLGSDRINVYVVDQKNKFVDYDKQPWTPVIIMSYEMFVRCHSDVCRYKFDLVICDEGHRLKNNAIKASTLLNNIDCKRRIILTGTPIQNNLQEFHALVDFVNPSVLGTYAEFRSTFEAPIVAARQPDTASDVIRKGEQCAEELNLKTSGFILRRTQELINKYLPTKHEAVVFCKPTAKQKLLYEAAVDFWEKRLENDCAQSPVSHLSVLIALKKISNHPFLIYSDDDGDDSPEESKNDVSKHLTSILESSGGTTENDSSKLNVLAALLENLRNTKERIVVVSYYKQTLDLIAAFCAQKQFTFSRLDGSTPATQRTSIIDKFNSTSCRDSVFLLSGKAGGTGLNLVGASRLVLFDSDWNPASDQQAMARIWRDGQSRSVHIYRLLTTGSIEEKIFQRQLSKASLGETVVDFVASNSTVRLSNKELKDLFKIHESNCFTHDLMECSCNGDGNVIPVDEKENSGLKEVEEEEDASQLNLKAAHKATNANLKMNQLFHWQHHSSPFSSTLLKEMGLEMADTFISFVFRNTTS